MKLNRAQLEADEIGALPEAGEYQFKVISAEEKTSTSSSDGKMTALVLIIRTEDGRVEKVKDWLGLWKNGAKKVLSFLDAVGLNPDEEHPARTLIGQEGVVAVKHGEFNGKAQLNVDYYVPRVEGEFEPVAVEDSEIPF